MTEQPLESWTKRLDKRICEEIRKQSPAAGYFYDLTQPVKTDVNGAEQIFDRVTRGHRWHPPNAPLPMVSLLQDVRPGKILTDDKKSNGTTLHYIRSYILQGWVDDDDANPTDPAHDLLADCIKTIGNIRDSRQDQPFLIDFMPKGGRVLNMGHGHGTVTPPDNISDKAYFWLEVWADVMVFTTRPDKI